MSKIVTFLSVDISLKTKPFNSVEGAYKTNPLFVIREEYSGSHTTQYGNTYKIFNYSFVNSDDFPIKPRIGQWSIYSVDNGVFGGFLTFDKGYQAYGVYNSVSFMDPSEEIRRIPSESMEEALVILRTLSIYNSWSEFDLKRENDKLRDTIIELTERINKSEE
jgi:hypothetical protein